MLTIDEMKALEKFEDSVRRREWRLKRLPAPSGRPTLHLPSERIHTDSDYPPASYGIWMP